MHAETCEATHERKEQSAELLDLRMSCLDHRLGSMRALVGELTTTSTQVVDRAVEAVLALDPIAGCGDAEQLRVASPLPSDPSQREKIEALQARIDELDALNRTGQRRRGLSLALEAAKDARTIGYPPVKAKVLWLVSDLYQASSQYEEAETATLELTRAAAEARDDAMIATAWQDVVYIIGHGRQDPKRAASYVPIAEAATVRASPDPHLEAKLHNTLGSLAYSRGDHQEAAKEFEQAVALWSKAGDSSQRFLARVLGNQATVLEELAKLDEAQAIFEQTLALRERLFGAEHPDLGTALEGLANVAKSRGDFEGSNQHQRRALALYVSVYGEENNNVSRVLYSIGWNEKELGNYAEAERSLRRSIEIKENISGKDHPGLGFQWNALGDLYVYQKKLEPARDCFMRALRMWEKIDHPDIAIPLANLGDLSNRTGRWREAIGFCTRALMVDEKSLGIEHPDLAFDLTCLGEAHLGAGSRAAALPVLERALKLRTTNDVAAIDRATTQLALARALGEGTRARELAQAARNAFAAAGKPGEDKLAIADGWLREHR
jgi:tetratricopeptide (TPR) repeat protein